MKKRVLSVVLAVMLVLTMLPLGSVTAQADSAITSLTTFSITEPTMGNQLTYDLSGYSDEVWVSNFVWSWNEGGVEKSLSIPEEVFYPGDDCEYEMAEYALPRTDYTLTITLQATEDEDDYEFYFDTNAFHLGLNDNVKLNGKACTVDDVSNGLLVFHYTFTTGVGDWGGVCGDYMRWSYVNNSKTLLITGSGIMNDYIGIPAPWADLDVRNLVLTDGILSLGAYAFAFTDIEEVILPKSLQLIDIEAFRDCKKLKTIHAFNKLTDINDYAFYGCSALTDVYFHTKANYIEDYMYYIGEYNYYFTDAAKYQGLPQVKWYDRDKNVEIGYNAGYYLIGYDNFYDINQSEGKMTYTWQVNKNGSWTDCANDSRFAPGNGKALWFWASMAMNGYKFRCKITNEVGTTTTAAQTLTVYGTAPTVCLDPQDVTAYDGELISFSADADGSDIHYQWQYYSNGKWTNVTASGANNWSYYLTATLAKNGRKYRCVLSNELGSVTTKAATLTVLSSTPVITSNPSSLTVNAGETASFTVGATGQGTLKYQWQVYKNGAWSNCTATGYNKPTYSFTAAASANGRRYRCKVTNSNGSVTSKYATLTVVSVAAPVITAQPQNVSVSVGKTATFTVTATGSGLTYQWQVSKDNGTTWSNCTATGYNTKTYSFTAKETMSGRKYRCIVKNSAGKVTSKAALLAVNAVAAPVITTQPTSIQVDQGATATFKVAATGTGLSYQWQVSKDNGATWSNCTATGANTKTYSFTTKASMNGRKYRCKITNAGGTVTSKAAKLTVVD